MTDSQASELRRTLEDLDRRLLTLIEGEHPLSEDALREIALYETARGAVLRLLDQAEARGAA